jgi:hypothetical protein
MATKVSPDRSIAIIVFFFGAKPWYENLFLSSCKRNPSITFLYFSDSLQTDIQSENIKRIPFSIDNFNDLATGKLGFQVKVKSGLKICDLRPAFGVIFEDYLECYEFWGYADTDLIFGDIRSFFPDSYLDSFDFFSVGERYPSGFFAVFRNAKSINELFMQCQDFQELIEHDENTLFEECGGYYAEVMSGINICDTDCPFDTLHHLLVKNSSVVRSSFRHLALEDAIGKMVLRNNTLICGEHHLLLFHLTKMKSNFFVRRRFLNAFDSLRIFRFTISQGDLISMASAYLYDHLCLTLMKISVSVDRNLKRTEKDIGCSGLFNFMNTGFSVENTTEDYSYVCTSGRKFRLFRSLLFKKKYLIEGLESYLEVANAENLKLLYHDGTVRNFRKIIE